MARTARAEGEGVPGNMQGDHSVETREMVNEGEEGRSD